MILSELFPEVVIYTRRSRCYSIDFGKYIPAVNIHPAYYRPNCMRGVLCPVVFLEIFCLPFRFPCCAVKEPVVDTIMGMGTVTMYNRTEHPKAYHVQNGEIILPEAPVFKHHEGNTGFFRCFNKLPEILHCEGSRNIYSRINSISHRMKCNFRVRIPGCSYNYSIRIFNLEQF